MKVPCLNDNITSATADVLDAMVHAKDLVNAMPEGDPRRGVLLYVLKSLKDANLALTTARRALEGCE